MKIVRITLALVAILSTGFAANVFAGGAQNKNTTVTPVDCPGAPVDGDDDINEDLTCYSVVGWSKGNHEINCTVIVPDNIACDLGSGCSLIAWANGWDQGNVLGQNTTKGYLRGLKLWAKEGDHVIAASNAWSVQESDVLACAQATFDNDSECVPGTDPICIPKIDELKIGLAGHSQGGGAVTKAGNGNKDVTVAAVLAMNPYGPAWVNPENQDGPVLILGGVNDTTTPPSSYQTVVDAIIDEAGATPPGPGGINAVSLEGTHNSDAWGTVGTFPDETTMTWDMAQYEHFGNFQDVGMYWFGATLQGTGAMMTLLNIALCEGGTWNAPQHAGIAGFLDCNLLP